MTPLAHAGHWAAQLLYLAPVLAMVGAILWAKIRGRGYDPGEDEHQNHTDSHVEARAVGPNGNQRCWRCVEQVSTTRERESPAQDSR